MSNNKFVKLFRINGTEVMFRKTFEEIEGKQMLMIVAHGFFDEFMPLGLMPEVQAKTVVCCLKHLDEQFQEIDGVKAKEMYELMRASAKKNIHKIKIQNINHN